MNMFEPKWSGGPKNEQERKLDLEGVGKYDAGVLCMKFKRLPDPGVGGYLASNLREAFNSDSDNIFEEDNFRKIILELAPSKRKELSDLIGHLMGEEFLSEQRAINEMIIKILKGEKTYPHKWT